MDPTAEKEITKEKTVIEKLKNNPGSDDKKPEKAEITKNEKAARTGDRSSFGLWLALLFVSGGTIASIAIVYRKKKASIMWDCSVTCMEASTSEKYVINYADSKVISKTGALTIQNRNDFDIVVHLLCEGEPEIVSDKISSGGCYSFLQVATDKEYTVGIHAAVDTKTEIKVFVYDGKDTEPYTK